jgi:hypothetical protein
MAEIFLEGNVEKTALSRQFEPLSAADETGVPHVSRFSKRGTPNSRLAQLGEACI